MRKGDVANRHGDHAIALLGVILVRPVPQMLAGRPQCGGRRFGSTKPNGRSVTRQPGVVALRLSLGTTTDLATLQTRPTEELLWKSKNTDLERRVLAHEQILQVLITHMAAAEPRFLDRLQKIFTKHWREQDSNPRSRFRYSPLGAASCRLGDPSPSLRQNGMLVRPTALLPPWNAIAVAV